jgi:hypothetical protein
VNNELVDQTRTTWKQLFGQVNNELVDQTRTTWKQLETTAVEFALELGFLGGWVVV